MVSVQEVREVLDERPDLEPVLSTVLEVSPPWTFEDVDVDSGTFGELVSQDFIETVEGGYQLSDPEVVRRAIQGEDDARPAIAQAVEAFPEVGVSRLELGAVIGALLFVVLFRFSSFPAVFQGDAIVLSSNDPYYYRYLLEQLVTDQGTSLSSLSGGLKQGEPLMLAVLWMATVALGGTAEAGGLVLAGYPVLSAVVTGTVIYALTRIVTDDSRVAVVAVLMLAVLPGHAFRTSVGFADHHAFDYIWLAFTIFGAVVVARFGRFDTNRTLYAVAGTAFVAVGVSGQILAWEAGPLLVVPLGATVAAMVITAVYRDDTVIRSVGPLVLGTVLAAGITWGVHATLGWHTTLVATTPLLLAFGSLLVLAGGVIWARLDLPVVGLPLAEAVLGGLVLFVFSRMRPELWTRVTNQFQDRLLARREIAEVQSIFSDSAGWLLLFGFLLLFALPYMAWATWRLLEDDRWTPVVVYAWYFFLLSVFQIRFVGQFSLLVAVFAGLGFVHLADWIDLARRPAPFSGDRIDSLTLPDRRQAASLVGLFLLVTGLSIVQVPVKTSQTTSANEGYDAAAWMSDYSEAEEMEYPDNYVFSQWGHNRMYNYFVSGESQSYGFARSNYAEFVGSSNATRWYERLRNRAGFVVTTPSVVSKASAVGTRLHEHDGSRTNETAGLAHYRLMHVEDGGAYKVFTLVEGAEIRGEAEPNATVSVRTTVELESYSFEYVRQVRAGADGRFSARVAHPGTYSVGEESVVVSEDAVVNGSTVEVGATANSSFRSVNRGLERVVRSAGGHGPMSGGSFIGSVGAVDASAVSHRLSSVTTPQLRVQSR